MLTIMELRQTIQKYRPPSESSLLHLEQWCHTHTSFYPCNHGRNYPGKGSRVIEKKKKKDGSRFKCSESFVWKYLHKTLGWSERRATKAAQKVPANHEEILMEAFLREACMIRDHLVPAHLQVNTDQTQLTYHQGTKTTWNEAGVKQVATAGQEEKHAFTLVPSISAGGDLLPMQVIFIGKTTGSCPSPDAPGYDEAVKLGYMMLPSKTSTYWSTEATMEKLVNDIIAPYFDRTKEELGLLKNQCSIWKINCWSVHKSKEF